MDTVRKLVAVLGVAVVAALPTSTAFAADEVYGSPATTADLPYFLEARLGGPLTRSYDFSGAFTGSYEPDPGFFITGSVGKYFHPNFRADIAVSYGRGHDGVAFAPGPFPHTGSISATSILANGYYLFNDVMPRITPFIGAGAGVTIFNYDNLGGGIFFNDTATAATVAGHLGVDYALTDMVDLTARYSLTWTGSHSISNPLPLNASSHTNNIFTVGLRIKFNN